MTTERWESMEALVAARERFAAAIPGWSWPAAAGVALVRPLPGGGEEATFPVVNTTQHKLPVVVLAGVLGHAGGTATYDLGTGALDRAIERLRPAAAATFMAHPNLEAWLALRATLAAEPAARAVAVFVADLADEATGPYDAELRARVAADAPPVP